MAERVRDGGWGTRNELRYYEPQVYGLAERVRDVWGRNAAVCVPYGVEFED